MNGDVPRFREVSRDFQRLGARWWVWDRLQHIRWVPFPINRTYRSHDHIRIQGGLSWATDNGECRPGLGLLELVHDSALNSVVEVITSVAKFLEDPPLDLDLGEWMIIFRMIRCFPREASCPFSNDGHVLLPCGSCFFTPRRHVAS